MAVSNDLELLQLTEAMSQKSAAVNTVVGQLEGLLSGVLSIATTDATTAGYELSIPFSDTDDLSDREALRNMVFTLSSGATAAFDLVHPQNPHLFIVKNNTTQVATVKTTVSTADTVDVDAGETIMIYCDGSNCVDIFAAYDPTANTGLDRIRFDISIHNTPGPDEVIGKFIMPSQTVLNSDFGGEGAGAVNTDPGDDYVISVQDDGTEIGTITFEAGGTSATFETSTTGSDTIISASSVLTLVAPSTINTDITEILATFYLYEVR